MAEKEGTEKDTERKDDAEGAADKEPQPETTVKADDEGNVEVRTETRKDRRAKRYDDLAREREEYRTRAERLEREVQEIRSQAAAAMQMAHMERARQAEPQKDPYKEAVEGIRREQERIQAILRSKEIVDPNELQQLKTEYYGLEDRRIEALERRMLDRVRGEVARPRDPAEAEAHILQSEFPEVVANGSALRWATGLFHQMVAEGKPANLTTSRAALKQASEKFGFSEVQAPPPSAAQQAKYGAVSAQAGANGAQDGIRLDKAAQRMALAMYPSLPEEDAFKKWAAKKERWEKRQADGT